MTMELSEHKRFMVYHRLRELRGLVTLDDVKYIENLMGKYYTKPTHKEDITTKRMCVKCGEIKDVADFGSDTITYPRCWDCRTIDAIYDRMNHAIAVEINYHGNSAIFKLQEILIKKYNEYCDTCEEKNGRCGGEEKCPNKAFIDAMRELDLTERNVRHTQEYLTAKALDENKEIVNMILFYKQIKRKLSNLKKQKQ